LLVIKLSVVVHYSHVVVTKCYLQPVKKPSIMLGLANTNY